MRIALCYSGEPRGFLSTVENHLYAFGSDGGVEIDFFGHIWGPFDSSGLPKFKKIIIEPKKELSRGASMFYSINKSINLASRAEKEEDFKYDFIFRMRTDLLFLGDTKKLDAYDGSKLNVAPNCVDPVSSMMITKQWLVDRGVKLNNFSGEGVLQRNRNQGGPISLNDWFAFGDSFVMSKYCVGPEEASRCSDRFRRAGEIPPEELLCSHVKKQCLEICPNDWELLLYREVAVN